VCPSSCLPMVIKFNDGINFQMPPSLSLAWLGLSTRVLTRHSCIHEKEFIPLQSSLRESSVNGAQTSK
jgi:hypothetical protein